MKRHSEIARVAPVGERRTTANGDATIRTTYPQRRFQSNISLRGQSAVRDDTLRFTGGRAHPNKFGTTVRGREDGVEVMLGFGSPFGTTDANFDEVGEFVPDHVPEPGPFLRDHRVLTDDEHVAFHETTRELFEERGVYDVTFDYNLAKLNRDRRHKDAGFRYAEEADAGTSDDVDSAIEDDSVRVLRAEFTPTTEFCPQTATLTKGAFRAWNGLSDEHEYDLVRVRAAPLHHESEAVNETLRTLGSEFLHSDDTSSVCGPDAPESGTNRRESPDERTSGESATDELPF
jgi:hypothetical protein